MSYQIADDTDTPRITPAVQWLIAINIAIYFLQLTVVRPEDVQQTLGFEVHDLGRSWWTIATYMFVHGGFWHLALNMYTLYLFGPRIERAWSAGEFARYYILCGLGGWFAHLLFARNAILFGASAAVLGVMQAWFSQRHAVVLGIVQAAFSSRCHAAGWWCARRGWPPISSRGWRGPKSPGQID